MAETASEIAGRSTGQLGVAADSEPEPFVYLTDDEPLQRLDVYVFEESGQDRRQK
jgi:hypothetical protein